MKINLNTYKSLNWEGDTDYWVKYDDDDILTRMWNDAQQTSYKKTPEITGMEMTDKRRIFLKIIMEWYWSVAQKDNLISKSDYEFVYDIWNNGLNFYTKTIQNRLNKIREIYIKSIEK